MNGNTAIDLVRPLSLLSRADVAVAGGKGASLGDLRTAGFPVPDGFVVTAGAYIDAMEQAADRQLLLELEAAGANAEPAELDELSDRARALILGSEIPQATRTAILTAYELLGDQPAVAVRSSATAEDTAETSFAGMNETFTNIRGPEDLLQHVRRCWASLYGARVMAYRADRGLTDEPAIAVVVQVMVQSDRSGVMFTVDPAARRQLVIEGAFGLGEVVVSGRVEPDTYSLDRQSLGIRQIRVGHKDVRIVAGPEGDQVEALTGQDAWARVLNDDEIKQLAAVGLAIEKHYQSPQDIEWSFVGCDLFIVQSRPITTLDNDPTSTTADEPLLRGLGVGSTGASGVVRILTSPKEGDKLAAGEILVAEMTSPDWVPILRRTAGLITDSGGSTCHAAIVSRELGVPAVVGTREATSVLRDGDIVTIEPNAGLVFSGADPRYARLPVPVPTTGTFGTGVGQASGPLATKILVNLAIADRALEAAALPVDGVGLLRGEFMVTDALDGQHPRHLIANGKSDEFIARMSASISAIAAAFAPRPVIYRTMDFRTNEFRDLIGGDQFEPVEQNPMIGYRGCYRYINDPATFSLELTMLARVRRQHSNLDIMIPFVRTPWELEACLKAIGSSELGDHRDLKTYVMAEVPSAIHHIPAYADLGIDGVSIGSNDLTQLMLGVDRDSETIAELFDESDGAVLWAIDQIVAACRKAGITSSLCGMAPSANPAFAEHLVRFGIDSISVDVGAVNDARAVVAVAEHRLLVDAARRSPQPD